MFEESNAEVTKDGVTWVPIDSGAVGHRRHAQPAAGPSENAQASVLQTRLALYTSYVDRARLPGLKNAGELEEALFWDTHSPYRYLRIDRIDGEVFAIAGGADNKTGQVDDPDKCYRDVESWLKSMSPGAKVTRAMVGTGDRNA